MNSDHYEKGKGFKYEDPSEVIVDVIIAIVAAALIVWLLF